jgi:anti-sigma factor RsiW
MTCREAIDFLMQYLDGELSPEVRAEFDHHLAICKSCTAYLQTYQETVLLGKAAIADEEQDATAQLPEDLVLAMLASLRQQRGE